MTHLALQDIFIEVSKGICDKSISILDIHEARWMSAYTTFKKKTRDLEGQFMNAIQSMLDCCGSLHQKAHNVQVGKLSCLSQPALVCKFAYTE